MKIVIYDTVKEFLINNESAFINKEAVTQLILFNGFVNRNNYCSREILFGRVESEDGTPGLIFCNVLPYNLIMCNLKKEPAREVKALADYLINRKISINGINGNKKTCDEFIEYYKFKTGSEFQEYLAMDIMEVRELNNTISLPKGRFREGTFKDLNTLIDWHIKFSKEALNEDICYEDFRDKLTFRIENKSIYIYEDENSRPVAMAAVTRELLNGVSISLVYSSKEVRGKGYGLAVVYYLSKLYLENGKKFCSLFVDKHNPISNGVYAKLGYKILEDNFDYRIVNYPN